MKNGKQYPGSSAIAIGTVGTGGRSSYENATGIPDFMKDVGRRSGDGSGGVTMSRAQRALLG